MKYLKIENDRGFYWNGTDYVEIDKINKDDLLSLLNSAENDEFEMELYDETLLGNKAHQIIYENIYSKLDQFVNEKDQFKKEVNTIYQDAISKYEVEVKDEDLEEADNFEIDDDSSEIDESDEIPF
jgi:hypothetical protein